MNYYNENDPFCVEWLWNLIDRGMISNGIVDNRSIKDVTVGDLDGFDQCHFFAGIGVWSYALTLAGWPDDRPVWTGSCPCQPFSAAGQRKGFDDDRHLWPEWFRLIREYRPVTIFGEQVSSALSWLDLVSGDLEGEGYAIGSAIMGAHSVGAPHIRQRIYWAATLEHTPLEQTGVSRCSWESRGTVADSHLAGQYEWTPSGEQSVHNVLQQGGLELSERISGQNGTATQKGLGRPSSSSYWSDCDWLPCIDGKSRPVESGTFPLAHGSPNRVGRLRGYGNALVAPQAQAFIEAYMSLPCPPP